MIKIFLESLVRTDVMTKIGKDVMPMLTMFEKDKQKPKYDLALNGTMIFFKRAMIHAFYEMNKHWICNGTFLKLSSHNYRSNTNV